jgi:hypothetical protein
MRHHRPAIRTAAWLVPALALLTACSGIPLKERDQARRERYESYAGPPIEKFTYLGHYDSWQPIGTNELVVWTSINQAYLIKVAPPCDNLQFANRVGLTSTQGTVYTRFDSVKVGHWRCPIQEMRPIDYLRMKQDLRKQTEEAKAAAKDANGT